MEREMDRERGQAHDMGENQLPDSNLTMCANMGENPQSSAASSSTQYSIASPNVVHDAGDLPAPKTKAPTLADVMDIPKAIIPKPAPPPPAKKPPLHLPPPKPRNGKYLGIIPKTPIPKWY